MGGRGGGGSGGSGSGWRGSNEAGDGGRGGRGGDALTRRLWDSDLLAGAAGPPVAEGLDLYDVIFLQGQRKLHRRPVRLDDGRAALRAPSVGDLPTQTGRASPAVLAGARHGPRRVCTPRAAGPGRGAQPGGSLWSRPGAASGDGRMLQPGVGGSGSPRAAGLPPPPGGSGNTPGARGLGPGTRCAILPARPPLGLVSPTCERALVTPAFLGRFQGRTAADFSEGPGSKEVWKRRQRSRGDWGGRTGRRPGQGGHRPPPAPWPLWTGASRQSGRVRLPPGALSELRGEQGAQRGDRCHPASVRRWQPPARAPSLSSGPRWSESGESASGTALEATQGLEDLALLKPTHQPGTAGSGRPQVRQEETEACRGAPSVGLPVTRV